MTRYAVKAILTLATTALVCVYLWHMTRPPEPADMAPDAGVWWPN